MPSLIFLRERIGIVLFGALAGFLGFFLPSEAFAATTDIKHDWTSTVGGSGSDLPFSTVTDSSGNVYTAGHFTDTVDFDSGAGTDTRTSNGQGDIFFTKHDRIGNYLWTRTFGGTDYDWAYALAFDPDGFVYLAGYVRGVVDLDPGAPTDMSIGAGVDDILFAKYDLDGNYVWGRTVGSASYDTAYGISLDSSGNVLVTGRFVGTVDFDPGVGVYNRTSNGDFDIFISKYDADGNHLWTRTFGGLTGDYGWSVATDASDDLYVGGYYALTVDFDPGPGADSRTSAGLNDIFLSRYDSSGNYQWTKTFGGSGYDGLYSMRSDPVDGVVFGTGYFEQTVDFDPGPGIESHVSNGGYDAYISAFDRNGIHLWTRTVGGAGNEISWPLARTNSGDLLIGGEFSNTVDFNPTAGVDTRSSNGSYDAFFSRYTEDGDYLWTKTFGGSGYDFVRGVAEGAKGDIFVTGGYFDSVDFDPGPDSLVRTANGIYDIFLSKFSPFSIDEDRLNLDLDINATIAISCDPSVTMNSIVATGQSTIDSANRAMCTIVTNDSDGYKLEWAASTAPMISASGDTLAAYTPAVSDTPETWSVATNDSEWGAKLGASSAHYDIPTWGNEDTYTGGKWLNMDTVPRQIAQRPTETDLLGDSEYVYFAVEVGSGKLQPAGFYSVAVTFTATTL